MGLMLSSIAFLASESNQMNREQRTENKGMTCTDCLFCKVASCSTRNSRLCFCAKDKNKLYDLEAYWLLKKVCKKFEDMSA